MERLRKRSFNKTPLIITSRALLVSLLPFAAFDSISGSERHKYNAEQKKHEEEAFYWSSIRILLVINENSRQKLMAVNEIRIVVYKYSVECCASISLTQRLPYKKFVLNGTEFRTHFILFLFLQPCIYLSIQCNKCGLRNY